MASPAAGSVPAMALLGGGVLLFWHDLALGTDIDDFNRWHNREHIPERVGVPGFLRGRRVLAAPETPLAKLVEPAKFVPETGRASCRERVFRTV